MGTPGAINPQLMTAENLLSLKHRGTSLKSTSPAQNEFDANKTVSPLKFKPSNKAAGEDPLLD